MLLSLFGCVCVGGGGGGMWSLIVLVPDYCLLFSLISVT